MNKSMIKKFYLFFTSIFIFLIHVPFVFAKVKASPVNAGIRSEVTSSTSGNFGFTNEPTCETTKSVYDSLRLGKLGLSRQAFDYAMKGFH